MKVKINNTLVKKILPSDKEYEVHDTDLKGFIIRVFPSGTMRYICQYQSGRKINIGTVGIITPAQAREKAVEILNDFNKGIDPKTRRGTNKPKTLEEFIEKEYKPWVLSHHKRGNKTLANLQRCFNKLYSKSLGDITPSIIEQWSIKRLNEGVSNATLNRDVGVLKSLMTKASEWGFLNESFKILTQLHEQHPFREGIVFLSKNNHPFNNVKRSWSAVLKKAEITQLRWHDLRHHFASKLVMTGIDLNTVRELLGHSDIKMTLRYAHLAPEHKINAVKKIDWAMQGT